MEKSTRAKELVDRLEPVLKELMVASMPGAGPVLQAFEHFSSTEKKEVQLRTAQQIADALYRSIPVVGAILPTSVLLAKLVLENPEAAEALGSPQVRDLATAFSGRIDAAEGRFDEEKEAINSTINEALTLPSSFRAAVVIVILGACGSASWDAVQYAYLEGQRILQVPKIPQDQPLGSSNSTKDKEVAIYASTVDGLRLRSKPSYDGVINALIYQDELVAVFETSGDWAFVTLMDRQDSINIGWVHTDYIEKRP